jgi:hypothetical protein
MVIGVDAFRRRQLAEHHGARSPQPGRGGRLVGRLPVVIYRTAETGFDVGRVEDILHGHRDAVQRTAPVPGLDFGMSLFGHRHRRFGCDRDIGMKSAVIGCDTLEHQFGERDRRQGAAADAVRQCGKTFGPQSVFRHLAHLRTCASFSLYIKKLSK